MDSKGGMEEQRKEAQRMGGTNFVLMMAKVWQSLIQSCVLHDKREENYGIVVLQPLV